MLLFPNAKINIGLKILRRRADGYHDLSSVFVPIGWCDILEITPSESFSFRQSGNALDCPASNNIVLKALRALTDFLGRELPPLEIALEKHIPSGAGLGGGSADAAFTLTGVNELLELGLDKPTLAKIAAKVGADCPFFIYNTPMLASGIGDILRPIDVDNLRGKYIVVVKLRTQSVSTAQAYAGVVPCDSSTEADLAKAVTRPVAGWRYDDALTNDFENSVFGHLPELAAVKSRMYDKGAVYSAMSGSGSAIFGIFDDAQSANAAKDAFKGCEVFAERF